MSGTVYSKSHDYECDTGEAASLGMLTLPFERPGGATQLVPCIPAGAAILAEIIRDDATIATFAVATSGREGPPIGIYAPLGANDLRQYAARMLKMADEIDGGRGKQ